MKNANYLVQGLALLVAFVLVIIALLADLVAALFDGIATGCETAVVWLTE